MLPEKEVGAKIGRLALLERSLKLKKKMEAYIFGLVSGGPRFVINSVRSMDGEPMNPPSLVLPMRALEEEQSACIIHADLARLFRQLKKVLLGGVTVVHMLKFLMGNGPACMSLRFLLIWSFLRRA